MLYEYTNPPGGGLWTLIALAFIFGYIERILPIYLGAPGVKLGLANLVTILSLYVLGLWPAVWISLARILLSGFAFGECPPFCSAWLERP